MRPINSLVASGNTRRTRDANVLGSRPTSGCGKRHVTGVLHLGQCVISYQWSQGWGKSGDAWKPSRDCRFACLSDNSWVKRYTIRFSCDPGPGGVALVQAESIRIGSWPMSFEILVVNKLVIVHISDQSPMILCKGEGRQMGFGLATQMFCPRSLYVCLHCVLFAAWSVTWLKPLTSSCLSHGCTYR